MEPHIERWFLLTLGQFILICISYIDSERHLKRLKSIHSLKCLIEKVSEATEVVRYRYLTLIDKTNIVFYRYVSSIIGIYPDRIVKKGQTNLSTIDDK
jgi:hypothetical protein